MRTIFSNPIELNSTAQRFSIIVQYNNGELNDKDLATMLDIPEREVRKIAERFNYDKYLNVDSRLVFKKIKGYYTVIDASSDLRFQVRYKMKQDFLASAKRWRKMEEKLGNVNLFNETMINLLEEE